MAAEASGENSTNWRNRPTLNPKEKCRVGCLNVNTMYRTGRAALVEQEMRRYGLEVMGLSEVRWHGKGTMKIGDTTIVYSGVDDGVHERGVAVALAKEPARMIESYECINERIMLVRIKGKFTSMTIIQVYAPTENSDDEEKDSFYERLSSEITKVKRHDMLLLMGDLNAKVGSDQHRVWGGVLGKFGVGVRNDNGRRLCEMCALHGHKVMNTVFNHKNAHK
jgi:exonuclease III